MITHFLRVQRCIEFGFNYRNSRIYVEQLNKRTAHRREQRVQGLPTTIPRRRLVWTCPNDDIDRYEYTQSNRRRTRTNLRVLDLRNQPGRAGLHPHAPPVHVSSSIRDRQQRSQSWNYCWFCVELDWSLSKAINQPRLLDSHPWTSPGWNRKAFYS